MLTKFMYFLESIHSIRSLISIIVLVIGIILIFIWKFKSKKASLLICSVIAIVIPCIVIAHGCYSAYLRPTSMKVELSQQELIDFSEYILENDRFLNAKDFLPNNQKNYFIEETKQYEYEDGQKVNYDFVDQRVIYQPNSAIYYWLVIYENEQDAQKVFEEMKGRKQNITVLKNENYSLFAEQSFNSTFFNYAQGEHNLVDLDIYILHKNYIICFKEHTERRTPKLYSLIKEKQLFDSDYKLTTLVE